MVWLNGAAAEIAAPVAWFGSESPRLKGIQRWSPLEGWCLLKGTFITADVVVGLIREWSEFTIPMSCEMVNKMWNKCYLVIPISRLSKPLKQRGNPSIVKDVDVWNSDNIQEFANRWKKFVCPLPNDGDRAPTRSITKETRGEHLAFIKQAQIHLGSGRSQATNQIWKKAFC